MEDLGLLISEFTYQMSRCAPKHIRAKGIVRSLNSGRGDASGRVRLVDRVSGFDRLSLVDSLAARIGRRDDRADGLLVEALETAASLKCF